MAAQHSVLQLQRELYEFSWGFFGRDPNTVPWCMLQVVKQLPSFMTRLELIQEARERERTPKGD